MVSVGIIKQITIKKTLEFSVKSTKFKPTYNLQLLQKQGFLLLLFTSRSCKNNFPYSFYYILSFVALTAQ